MLSPPCQNMGGYITPIPPGFTPLHDIYYMAILKFYSKLELVNDNLPNYFESLTPQFSAGHQHYNFRNPSRLLPKIKHEFPRQSLRYKLISTLNETSNELLEMARTL